MIASAGPERSGEGTGVPVPSRTTCKPSASTPGAVRGTPSSRAPSLDGSLGATGAGDASAGDTDQWQRVAGPPDALSTAYAFQRGIYAEGPKLVAVNRPASPPTPPCAKDIP